MRTYYRDRHVHVTSSALRVGDRCFALDQLDYVWRARGRLAHRRILVAVAVLLGAVSVRLVTGYALSFDRLRGQLQRWPSAQVNVAVLVGAGLIGMVVALLGVVAAEAALRAIEDIRGHGRHRELWALVCGEPVLLWRTTDATRFGHVCRALVRARDSRPGRAADPVLIRPMGFGRRRLLRLPLQKKS